MKSIVSAQQVAGASLLVAAAGVAHAGDEGPFQRIASFPVFENTDVGVETVAEIVTSAREGNLLVYTDSEQELIGFVDITDPANPQADGTVALDGEPTSVAVRGDYALAAVNTSIDFINTSGNLEVIDIETRQIVRTIALGGQPDAIAVSPDGTYAAIAIENERDEDLGNGEPPQLPAGFVVVVDIASAAPGDWTTEDVSLVNIPTLFPTDPEPEFVDINDENIAVVTLQENNHIVLIRLSTAEVIADYSAGTVDLTQVDILENGLIEQGSTLEDVPREPDAVAWTSSSTFVTADEGDLFGGSRGFTAWSATGALLAQPGNALEHAVARLGHYPEERSENKGNEPEGAEFGLYGDDEYLFVGSERSSVVFVYELSYEPFITARFPRFVQVLPAGVGPEGLHAIPERDLFVVANEVDARDDKIRSSIMIYERTGSSTYPMIESNNRPNTTVPIPWGALSGLAADPARGNTVFTVHDSFYGKSRIYRMDARRTPAVIEGEIVLRDTGSVLIDALDALKQQLPGTDDFDPQSLVNADGTVNLDLEGVEVDGDFWVCSEGTGNLIGGVSNPDDRPFESPNIIARVSPSGEILEVVFPPIEVTRNQLRFGFEGVAVDGDKVYVAFQRAWQESGDPSDRARLGRYDTKNGEWGFAYYPLDTPTSPNGGWVGSSEITALGDGNFAVLERDNQGGPDGTIKRVYSFSIDGVDFLDQAQAPSFDVLNKTMTIDLVAADVYGPGGGLLPEKQEGMTVLGDGTVLIVNDNDGVDDNSGETRLLRLESLFD